MYYEIAFSALYYMLSIFRYIDIWDYTCFLTQLFSPVDCCIFMGTYSCSHYPFSPS